MDVSSFPFVLDGRTRQFLSQFLSVLQETGARLSAPSAGVNIQFQDKGANSATLDAGVVFSSDGVRLIYPMNAVAKVSEESREWLQAYHAFLQQSKSDTLTPVSRRCLVMVEAKYGGHLNYYMTYVVAHNDGSLAQDTPQGRLFRSEGLFAARPASPAQQAEWGQQQAASAPAPAKQTEQAAAAHTDDVGEPAVRVIRPRRAIGL